MGRRTRKGLAKKAKRKGTVVLSPHHAVGEAAVYSHYAALYHKLGYKVYVDPHAPLTTNPQAYEILYLKNPYIAGQKAKEPSDIFHGVTFKENWRDLPIAKRRVDHNPNILKFQNFSIEDRILRINYVPRLRPELFGTVLLDMNISNYRLEPGGRDNLGGVADYVRKHYPRAIAVRREVYDIEARGFSCLSVADEYEHVEYSTIYDYCDIVASVDKVVCLQTGSQLFAAVYCDRVDTLVTEKNFIPRNTAKNLVICDSHIELIDVRP